MILMNAKQNEIDYLLEIRTGASIKSNLFDQNVINIISFPFTIS